MNIFTEILGFAAGSLTTFAFLPQLIKTWRSKSAKDISLGMFIAFCFGVLFWLIYGILIKTLPLIIFNGITLIFALIILIFKLIYK